MAFNAEGTPNAPRNRNQSRQWQLYMEGRIGESAQNTPNQMNPSNPPRHNNHMHQRTPFTADDMGTYDQNFPNQRAPDDPRPPFIPRNSSHLNGTANYTARKTSGVHHFYLDQMVPSASYRPSPSLPSFTRNIRLNWRSSIQMHMAPSFLPLGHMHDPRSINELPFDATRGSGNSDYFSPLSTLSNNNGQGPHPVSFLNNKQAQKTPNTTSAHNPKPFTNTTTSPDCTICLSPLPAPKVALIDPCHHEFCLNCIQHWIQTQRKRVVGSRRRHKMDAVNAAAEEQRRRELDVAGHTGNRIEEVQTTLDRVGLVGNQVLEARRRGNRWGSACTGLSTREDDLPSNGAANWWT